MESSLGPGISFGPFRLHPAARVIERDGVRVSLGSRAFDILVALVEQAGEIVGHRELTQRVWRGLVVTPSSLRVHVASLRKALGEGDDDCPQYIANVPGQGYSFVAPIERDRAPAPAVAAPAESAMPAGRPDHNLPNQLTSFVGRETELRQLAQLMTTTRLVTLTGSGGCGKTRLALQLADALLDEFADGCRLVELGPLTDGALVVPTLAKLLGFENQAQEALTEAIVKHLADQRLLLVLDNAEHLVEACAALADELLRRCARLHILVTSREPLALNGELCFRVPSLSLPQEGDATVESVLAGEAAQLFVERARLHRPDFEVTPKNAARLAAVCRRVDGIALALELAASRLRAMSIEDLDKHLHDRFGILAGGHRTAMPRHRTLRALIDWSYDLLSSAEKTVLRRVAVFAGGWTVESAECVCVGDSVGRGRTLELLTSLADKSILIAEPLEDGTRFGMLETVRDYALERLRDSGEQEVIHERHFECFAAESEALDEPGLSEEAREPRLRRLDREIDNLRVALDWCDADPARAGRGLRMVGKLIWFWMMRGYFSEGRQWIARFLEMAPADADDQEDRAKALHTQGGLAYHQDDYEQTVASLEEALAIYRRLGRRDRVGSIVGNLGIVEVNRGHYDRARELMDEALAIARDTGDKHLMSLWLFNLGVNACATDDFERARVLLEECLPISREAGRWSAAGALQQLGWVRHAQGRSREAHELLVESLGMHREFDDKVGIARTLYYLAMVSHDQGDIDAAKAQLREALALEQTVGDRILTASTLEVLAGLSLDFATPVDAARLWGSAQRLREEICAPQELVLKRRTEGQVALAREALGDDTVFDAAWRDGRAMTLEEMVRFAATL